MAFRLIIFFCVLSSVLVSQTLSKEQTLKKISQADTVIFSVSTSGCFDAGTKNYSIIKQNKCKRKVFYNDNGKQTEKIITNKQFNSFIESYKKAEDHFNSDKPATCTMTTDFELNTRNAKISFQNGTCENEYHPENFILELVKTK